MRLSNPLKKGCRNLKDPFFYYFLIFFSKLPRDVDFLWESWVNVAWPLRDVYMLLFDYQ